MKQCGGRLVLACMAVLLAGFAGGCARPDRASQSAAADAVDEVVMARRQWVASREAMLADVIAHPAKLQWADDDLRELIQLRQAEVVRAYEKLRDDGRRSAAERLAAVLALRRIGVGGSDDEIVRIASSDSDALLCLMAELPMLYPQGATLSPQMHQLVANTIRDGDDWVSGVAARWAGLRAEAGLAEAVLERFARATDPQLEELLGYAAGRLRPSLQLLQELQRRMRPGEPLFYTHGLWGVAALGRSTSDVALRDAAADVCWRYLSAQPDLPGMDGAAMEALDLISALEPKEAARARLKSLADGAAWAIVRIQAGEALAALEASPQAGAISHPESSDSRWAAIGRSLVEHGVIKADEAAATCIVLRGASLDGPAGVSFLAKAKRAVVFDAESGSVPCRHDLLVGEFSRASAGHFRPEVVLESYRSEEPAARGGRYRLQFVHAGKVYRTELQDHGDWYDVAGVVGLIHRALSDAGVAERFVPVNTGDQTAIWIFGPPEAVRRWVETTQHEIGTTADTARTASDRP